MPDVHKVVIFLKRKPGMSIAEFREYYETVHRRKAEKYTSPSMIRYVRRYVEPVPNLETGQSGELDFDVMTEMWFDNAAHAQGVLKIAETMGFPPDIVADEENVFDRTKTRYAAIVEHEA
jgi:hypothetical protein